MPRLQQEGYLVREDVAFRIRNYPIQEIHFDSYNRAIASECALLQGVSLIEFFEKNLTMNYDSSYYQNNLPNYLAVPSFDINSFLTCFNNKQTKNIVDKDIADANLLTVLGVALRINSVIF